MDADITAQEAELYDRQIRLWGLDAQKRLRAARVLMIGAPPLAGEVAKNLVLAGVRSLTLMDDTPLTTDDINDSFIYDAELLVTNSRPCRSEAALAALKDLNPMVDVTSRAGQPDELSTEVLSVEGYEALVAIGQPVGVLQFLNRICRDAHSVNGKLVQFFAADCFGCHGYAFLDLQNHEYAAETKTVPPKAGHQQAASVVIADGPSDSASDNSSHPAAQPAETQLIKRRVDYPDFESVLKTRWDPSRLGSLRRLPPSLYLTFLLFEFQRANGGTRAGPSDVDALKSLWRAFAESQQLPANLLDEAALNSGLQRPLCPVLAILGGVTAQEVIKAVSHKDDPCNNFFVFDGIQSCGSIQTLG